MNYKRQDTGIPSSSLWNLNAFREILWWHSLKWRSPLCARCPQGHHPCPVLPSCIPWAAQAALGALGSWIPWEWPGVAAILSRAAHPGSHPSSGPSGRSWCPVGALGAVPGTQRHQPSQGWLTQHARSRASSTSHASWLQLESRENHPLPHPQRSRKLEESAPGGFKAWNYSYPFLGLSSSPASEKKNPKQG